MCRVVVGDDVKERGCRGPNFGLGDHELYVSIDRVMVLCLSCKIVNSLKRSTSLSMLVCVLRIYVTYLLVISSTLWRHPLFTHFNGPLTNCCRFTLVVLHSEGRSVIGGINMWTSVPGHFRTLECSWFLSMAVSLLLKRAYSLFNSIALMLIRPMVEVTVEISVLVVRLIIPVILELLVC